MHRPCAGCHDGVALYMKLTDDSIKLPPQLHCPPPAHRRTRPYAMDPRSWFGDLTGYFVYMLFVATLGPLLFGFHLVCCPPSMQHSTANRASLSSTPPKMSSAARRSPSPRPTSPPRRAPACRNASR